MEENYFKKFREIEVSSFVERKGNLTYLSWAKAWDLLKQQDPDASFEIHEKEGIPYFTDGKWVWVKVTVHAMGHSHTCILPVMNHMNKALTIDTVDMNLINKSIMRCLTKATAMHGIGLSLYIGEDLPSENTNHPNNRTFVIRK